MVSYILFKEIMETMGLDLSDDSLKGTPKRVAKMYIEEIFSGLNPANKPKIALFEISINITKCWLRKILVFIQIVSIILYL